MSQDQATVPERKRHGPSPAALGGRRAGILLFWLMAAYVVGAAALSVIPSLYWPKYAPVPRTASITRCADELDRLQRELVRQAGSHLANPDGGQGLSSWLGRWDARLLSLSGDCGPLEPARDELQRLRADVERLLRRYDRDQAPTLDRIQRLLSSYQETTSS